MPLSIPGAFQLFIPNGSRCLPLGFPDDGSLRKDECHVTYFYFCPTMTIFTLPSVA